MRRDDSNVNVNCATDAGMSIEEQLNDDLKNSMRSKATDTMACIRQLKSKVQETVNAKGFSGPVDDALYQKVIGSYTKSLEKGITELAVGGERTQALRDKYAAEIAYLNKYLPKTLDEAQTLSLVQAAVATLSTPDPKQAGKIMGMVLKDHKGEVDSALLRSLIDRVLSQG